MNKVREYKIGKNKIREYKIGDDILRDLSGDEEELTEHQITLILEVFKRERKPDPSAPEGWSYFLDVVEKSGASGPLMGFREIVRALRKLCASGVIRTIDDKGKPIPLAEWKRPDFDPYDNYLNNDDLEQQWLACNSKPLPKLGKQPLIRARLAEMFPNGVPDPALCNRKTLKGYLLKRDPGLNPLDEATLKSAIDAHNLSVSLD